MTTSTSLIYLIALPLAGAALLPDGTPAPTSVNASLEARGDMLDYKSFDLSEVNTQIEEEK